MAFQVISNGSWMVFDRTWKAYHSNFDGFQCISNGILKDSQSIFNLLLMESGLICSGFGMDFRLVPMGDPLVVKGFQVIFKGFSMDFGRTCNERPTQPHLQNKPTSIEHLSKSLWKAFERTVGNHWKSIANLSTTH